VSETVKAMAQDIKQCVRMGAYLPRQIEQGDSRHGSSLGLEASRTPPLLIASNLKERP
jgi:hypothetical protein